MSDTAFMSKHMETEPGIEEFISSGRTGRRNALGDVMNARVVELSVAGLSGDFVGIAVRGKKLYFCSLGFNAFTARNFFMQVIIIT